MTTKDVLASEAADLWALLGAGNPTGRPRFITNTCVSLRAPMRFDRPDPSDFSVLERSVLRALGVPRLDFRAAGVRERRLANDFVDTRFPQCVERERKQQVRQCSSSASACAEPPAFSGDLRSETAESVALSVRSACWRRRSACWRRAARTCGASSSSRTIVSGRPDPASEVLKTPSPLPLVSRNQLLTRLWFRLGRRR